MNLVPSILPALKPLYLRHFAPSDDMDVGVDQPEPLPPEDSDLDAEGEEVDEDDEFVRVVAQKEPVLETSAAANSDSDSESESEDSEDEGEDADADADEDGDTDTSTETDPENEWEAESGAGEDDGETKTMDSNRCVFCEEDEENDPSDEFEEYLECLICGDNSHRQCARSANTLHADTDPKRWRCKTCLELEPKEDSPSGSRSRSSAPKVARELLPAQRGNIKPDSHSVFNTLILDDDPMDGSRSLRKRKASQEDHELPERPLRKRRLQSNARSTSAGAERSISVFSEEADIDVQVVPHQPKRGPGRPRRVRKPDKDPIHVVSSEGISLILSFNLGDRMQKILSSRPRKNRNRERSKKKIQPPPLQEPQPSHYPGIQSGYSAQFYAWADRETEDSKSKPYGGILSETDADTSKTFPVGADRQRFEDARMKAEEDWREKMDATNNQPEATKPSHKMSGPPSKIKCISFGGYEIDTWHAAPYPEEYSRNKILYICEFCLKYMNSDYVAWRHKLKCPAKHPPGDEIYRDGKYSYFEVDGRKNPVYCQNLCLLAKLFLGSKTLYYDVEPFLFYVMTENDDLGCHFVGYFSKEKRPSSMNNVSCILVLPIYQRRGFGHMLIEFSYLLTRVEQKTGSPEKPLSDMGLVSYRGYWRLVLCYQLVNQNSPISITQISEQTGMTADDIISALEGLRALVRDPVTKTYALRLDYPYFKEYIEKYEKKNYPRINPDALVWVPYVMNRGLSHHYEVGGPLQTVAPREEEEEDDEDDEDAKDGIKALTAAQTLKLEGIDVQDAAIPTSNGVTSGAATSTTSNHDEKHTGEAPSPGAYSQPSTPLPNGHSPIPSSAWTTNTITALTPHPGSAIPPTRFEVFPPVPGVTAKRRPGRPLGSRRTTGTPVQRTSNSSTPHANGVTIAMGNASPATSAGRRTRSMLGLGEVEFANDASDDGSVVQRNVEASDEDDEVKEDVAATPTPDTGEDDEDEVAVSADDAMEDEEEEDDDEEDEEEEETAVGEEEEEEDDGGEVDEDDDEEGEEEEDDDDDDEEEEEEEEEEDDDDDDDEDDEADAEGEDE